MSRAIEEINRSMLRVRDTIDGHDESELDRGAPAAVAPVTPGAGLPIGLRRVPAPPPAAVPGRAGHVPAAVDDAPGDTELRGRRFAGPGTFGAPSPSSSVEVSGDLMFGSMRRLTVTVPGDPTEVLLELPGPFGNDLRIGTVLR